MKTQTVAEDMCPTAKHMQCTIHQSLHRVRLGSFRPADDGLTRLLQLVVAGESVCISKRTCQITRLETPDTFQPPLPDHGCFPAHATTPRPLQRYSHPDELAVALSSGRHGARAITGCRRQSRCALGVSVPVASSSSFF